MQLNLTTDYALRILLYLGAKNEMASAAEIAEKCDVPRTYLYSVEGKLRSGGLIKTVRGSGGGILLAKAPSRIRLYDVYVLTEKKALAAPYLEAPTEPRNPGEKNLFAAYRELQRINERYLKEVTISSLLKEE